MVVKESPARHTPTRAPSVTSRFDQLYWRGARSSPGGEELDRVGAEHLFALVTAVECLNDPLSVGWHGRSAPPRAAEGANGQLAQQRLYRPCLREGEESPRCGVVRRHVGVGPVDMRRHVPLAQQLVEPLEQALALVLGQDAQVMEVAHPIPSPAHADGVRRRALHRAGDPVDLGDCDADVFHESRPLRSSRCRDRS